MNAVIEKETKKLSVKIWDIKELLSTDFPEPIYIIPGLITQGLNLLVGGVKLGKSWAALDMASMMSSGGLFLGKYQLQKGHVLFLALEDTPRRIQSRLIKQGVNPDIENCHIITEIPKEEKAFLFLHNYMKEFPDTKLIIIDTLTKFVNIKDHNDYKETVESLSGIKKFADDYNISIVVIHHAKKAEVTDFVHAAIGSIGITGTADTILLLAKKRGEVDAVLSVTGRDVEEQELALKFNKMNCRWSIVGNAIEVAETRERQEIIDLLKLSSDALSPKNIADALKRTTGSVKFLLMKMIESGQVKKVNRGAYTSINANYTNLATNPNFPNLANFKDEQLYIDEFEG